MLENHRPLVHCSDCFWNHRVQKSGAEAKESKPMIVEKLIYPTEPDRDAVLAAAKSKV
jgi:hypothetical protein